MYAGKSGMTKRFLFAVCLAVIMTSLLAVSAMATQKKVEIEEGTYYIKAVNGNAKGQVLYWNEKASDQNMSMMFESSGGKNAENEIWYITKNRNFDDYYGIYLAKDYTGNKDRSKRIEIDNLTGKDNPYRIVGGNKGPHVFCGAFGNQDDAFEFLSDDSVPSYTNLKIRSRDDQYIFFRHKDVKIFKSDIIFVKANKKNDTSDKLWELIPVNYVKKMSRTALSVTAGKNGKVSVNWDKFRNKIKNTKAWKNAQYIEIEYSTDQDFRKNVKSKKIRKGSVDKAKAKTAFAKLKIDKTYYIHARLIDSEGVATNWSKTVAIGRK